MPYTPTSWVSGTTALSQSNMNNIETMYTEATNSFEQDLFAGYVLYGLVASKDTSTANQLDVTSGVAFLLQTDSTLRRRAPTSSTQTTSTHSTTYNLYLQPAGTWYWSTSNSPAANSLFIASVATDGSGNISTITNQRGTGISIFPTNNLELGSFEPLVPIAPLLTQKASQVGTVGGGVTFGVAGAIKNSFDTAASFNGTTGYISSFNMTSMPSGNGAWSVEAWVDFASNPASPSLIFSFGATGAGNNGGIYIDTSGKPNVSIDTRGAVPGSSALSTNVWHHVVGTYDGTNMRVYADGSLVGGPTAPTGGSVTIGSTLLTIGAAVGVSFFQTGSLDEVAVYTTALSAARITAHYNAGISQTSSAYPQTILSDSPVRYYRLGDAAGASSAACTTAPTATTMIDAGGNITAKSVAGTSTASLNAFIGTSSNSGNGDILALVNGVTTSYFGIIGWGDTSSTFGAGLWCYDKQANGYVFQGGTKNGISFNGSIASLGGQATAGSFGVPVIVAQAINTSVTVTSQQTILSFTPAANGIYRVYWHVEMNGTANPIITVGISWQGNSAFYNTDPAGMVSGTLQQMAAVTVLGTPNVAQGFPWMLYATTAQPIVVKYTNTKANPNDHVTVVIERLA
jgi:Concanavalin A-like lectin/glucanases superfamily